MDPKALLDRAERTFRGAPIDAIQNRYRAVVGPSATQVALVRSAMEKLRDGEVPSMEEVVALEHAIRAFRPSVTSSRGALGALEPEAAAAFPAWGAFASRFPRFAYAIGRVDLVVGRDMTDQPVGTCFLVRPAVVVTNRHVVRDLERGGYGVAPGSARVRFGQERGTVPDPAPVGIGRVIAEHESLDLALLELDAPVTGVAPLALAAAAPSPGSAVATVGYPARDDLRNPMFARVVFAHYEVKQAAPGEVIATAGPVFHHDCSTLGGSSGSPVFTLDGAEVLGVHFAGGYLVRNEAVAASSLGELLAAHRL